MSEERTFKEWADKLGKVYNKIYQQKYPPSHVQRVYWPWVRGYFASGRGQAPRPARLLLDVGCGWQNIREAFQTNFPEVTYQGLDVAEHVRPMFLCSAHSIPVPDGLFYYIWSCEFIEHIPPSMVDAVLKEIQRVLKPDGRMFMSAATEPSGRKVDGMNLHLSVNEGIWWRKKLSDYFIIDDIWQLQRYRFGFLLRK